MVLRVGIIYDLHARFSTPSMRTDNYFESCMSKLEYILQRIDIGIHLGDFFEKARTEDVVKNRILEILNRYDKKLYTVLGNHDFERDVLETLPNTSLGNLLYHKQMTLLTPDRVWEIAGLKVGVLDYFIENAKKQSFDDIDIVVGHHAYEWGRDPSKGIEEADIKRYNAKYAFFGHDHQPYDPKVVGKTTIYRCGSTMRTDAQAYTPTHIPSFIILEVDEKKGKILGEPKIVPIECALPYEECFRVDQKRTFKKLARVMSDVKNLLDKMELDKTTNRLTIGTILKERLKAPDDIYNYLELVYRMNHLEF